MTGRGMAPSNPTPETHTTVTPGRKRGVLTYIVPALIFMAMAGMFAFALKKGDPSRLPSALIGKPAPEFTVTAIEGLNDGSQPVKLFTREMLASGKPSVVNFWASWCIPCIEEHPLLIQLARETGVAIFGVNYKDQAVAARRFLGRYGNPFAAVGADTNGRAAIEWGVYGMPETFVLDGEGRILYKHIGPLSAQALRETVIPAIERARAAGR